MKKVLSFLLKEVLYNGHLQAFGAVGIIYTASFLLFSRPLSLASVLSCYLVFQMIFLFDRFRDRKIDAASNKERSQHLESYAAKIPTLLVLMFITSVFLLLSYANILSFLLLMVILVLGILYPIYFKGLTRRIFMFKNWYVAGVYCLLVFFPFLIFSQKFILSFEMLLVIGFVFFENISSQIVLDTKDTKEDKQRGLRTLPAVIGNKKSLYYAGIFATGVEIVILVFAFVNQWNPLFFVLVIANFMLNQQVLAWVKRGDKKAYIFSAAKFSLWLLLALSYSLL